jgi:hypothetical protein
MEALIPLATTSAIDITIQSAIDIITQSAIDIYKKFKQIEERKVRKFLLPHWYLAFDEQLDDRLHLKITIAKSAVNFFSLAEWYLLLFTISVRHFYRYRHCYRLL